jgi:hypothetical protein
LRLFAIVTAPFVIRAVVLPAGLRLRAFRRGFAVNLPAALRLRVVVLRFARRVFRRAFKSSISPLIP